MKRLKKEDYRSLSGIFSSRIRDKVKMELGMKAKDAFMGVGEVRKRLGVEGVIQMYGGNNGALENFWLARKPK